MRLAFAAFAIGSLAGLGAAFAAPAAPSAAAIAEAKAIIQASCVSCHDEAQIIDARHSEAGWDETLNRMAGMGAMVSPADLAKLKAYLVAAYPDKAPAK